MRYLATELDFAPSGMDKFRTLAQNERPRTNANPGSKAGPVKTSGHYEQALRTNLDYVEAQNQPGQVGAAQ